MRVILAAIIGAVLMLLWGFLAWPTLLLWSFAITNLPSEHTLAPAFKMALPGDGAYVFPGMRHDETMSADQRAAAQQDWLRRHTAGPIGMVLYRETGTHPTHWSVFARGAALYFIGAFILAVMMRGMALRSFIARFGFGVLLAAFAMLMAHGSNWIWFFFPDTYTIAVIADGMIGWVIASMAIAAIVRPAPL